MRGKAIIFTARDFTPTSFVLFSDGKKWKHSAACRRALYFQLASHGEIEWAGVESIGAKCGFSRATTFRLLDDLYALGCVSDGTDDAGHKYHGHKRTRVRHITTDTLPVGATGWMNIPELGMLVRVVKTQESQIDPNGTNAGVSDTQHDHEHESQIDDAGVSDSDAGVSRIHETQKKGLKELSERTNTNPKDIEAVRAEFLAGQDKALTLNAQQRAALEAAIIGYDEEDLRAAVRRAISSGDFDGLRSSKICAERLTDHLTQWLPKVREERLERARQENIVEELHLKSCAKAQAKQRADDIIELEDARAQMADFELFDDESKKIMLEKIQRLEAATK